MSFNEGGLQMSLARTAQSGVLELKVKRPQSSKLSIFDMEEPNRLVLDLKNTKLHPSRNKIAVSGSNAVSGVRLGRHPDKLRIVLDLKSSSIPRYSWNERGDVVTLLIPESGVMSAQHFDGSSNRASFGAVEPRRVAATASGTGARIISASRRNAATGPAAGVEAPAASYGGAQDSIGQAGEAWPVKAPARSEPPKENPFELEDSISDNGPLAAHARSNVSHIPEVPAYKPSDLSEARASLNPRVVSDQPVTGIQSLTKIAFDYAGEDGQPVIKLSLTGRPQFFLLKKDSRTYRMIVPGYRLASNQQALPQFPPQDFNGFTMAVAKQKEKGIEVLVGVEDGTRVTAFARDGQVWIKKL